MLLLNICTGLDYFIRLHTVLHISIEFTWVDLINVRQQETHYLFDNKSEFHGINLLRGNEYIPKITIT